MAWPFKNKDQERQRADAVNAAVHRYYESAKKRVPGKKDAFYLALTWAIFAKKHHAEQYKAHELTFLLVAGSGDTGVFSLLSAPDSINALALYMIHKERISVAEEYEPEFNMIMSKIALSESDALRKAQEAAQYVMGEAESLDGFTENDF